MPERGHKSCERGRLHESAGVPGDRSALIQRAVSRRLVLNVCCWRSEE